MNASVISIRQNLPTVLMADDASHADRFEVRYERARIKRYPISGWKSPENYIEWQVDSPSNTDYSVTALVLAHRATMVLRAPGSAIQAEVESGPTGWNRVELGHIHLRAGHNTLRLTVPVPGEGIELYSLEFATPDVKKALWAQAEETRADASWMRTARYGLQLHWTSQSKPRRGTAKPYAEAVRNFDVERFADLVKECGAGYIIMTTSHAEYFFPAPIQSIDAIMPGRTSERDLVADIADALSRRGIKLLLYYHVGHGFFGEPDGWWQRTGYDSNNPKVFFSNWRAIMQEIGDRYRYDLAGWFYDDGCVYYPLNPDFAELTSAAKTGNPDRLVCYNPWEWPRFTDFQDYLCGEGYGVLLNTHYLPEDGTGIFVDGPHRGLQAHANFELEDHWVHAVPNSDIARPRIPKDEFVADMTSAIARGIVPSVNLEIYQDGGLAETSVEYLLAVREALGK